MKRPFQLYALLTVGLALAYLYLILEWSHLIDSRYTDLCLFKRFTHLPCPSCGTTRSILAILHGEWIEALSLNPLGYLLAMALVALPVWMVLDVALRNVSLWIFYLKSEALLKSPFIASVLIVMISINWIWNVIKPL